jgi:hypothetical protein
LQKNTVRRFCCQQQVGARFSAENRLSCRSGASRSAMAPNSPSEATAQKRYLVRIAARCASNVLLMQARCTPRSTVDPAEREPTQGRTRTRPHRKGDWLPCIAFPAALSCKPASARRSRIRYAAGAAEVHVLHADSMIAITTANTNRMGCRSLHETYHQLSWR